MTQKVLITFRSGTLESTNEKFKQITSWLIEQEIGFEITSSRTPNGRSTGRTLTAEFVENDFTIFNIEMLKFGFILD